MSVDVEIYLKTITKFFRDNPQDLVKLIPKEMEEDFYRKIKIKANENFNNGKDVILTQKQILEICVELNNSSKSEINVEEKIFQKTPYGIFSLN